MEDNNSHGTLKCGVTAACFIRQHDRSVGGARMVVKGFGNGGRQRGGERERNRGTMRLTD